MYTKEPKLKKFVDKWNKRNADIQRKKKEEVTITYTYYKTKKEDENNGRTRKAEN